METYSEKIICSLCGNKSANHFTQKNNCTLYKCDMCGFLFVYPIPDSSQVYDRSYFSGAEDGFGYVDYDTDKEPMIPTFEKYLDMVEVFGKTSGKLLDVGSATGFFMNLAQKRGFDCTGVELSDFAAEKGRSKGLHIITGDLESAKFSDQMFDVVTMCDVLEHVTDPKSFLLEAKRILKKDGLLVVNTPNAGSLVAKIFGPKWHLIVPPEHLHYFSVKNLSDFLMAHGFSIQVSTTIGKRFTLQYIFKTLYKWQKFSFWNWCATFFSKGFLSKMYIPLNTHDNFFMIAEKND